MLAQLTDDYFMAEALVMAYQAFDEDEIPVGAVITCRNQIIARTYNQTELLRDATAHAEILAITAASEYLGAKYLKDCTLYVTLEPCVMCAGALFWTQIGKVVYGAHDEKRGYSRLGKGVMHPKTQVVSGVLAQESKDLLTKFFGRLRT
jgi:tRNA(adenine34) deaminase